VRRDTSSPKSVVSDPILSFHRSGFLVASPDSTAYGSLSLKNDLAAGARVERISTPEELQAAKIFPEGLELGDLLNPPMLHNFEGGWAEAAEGVKRCIELVREMGGKVIGGKKAVGVTRGEGEGGKVNGVRFEDGSVMDADIVVLATGSWTAPSFPDLKLDKHVFASGCVHTPAYTSSQLTF
jgi:sarcosine oxidase/L-pipecolate oxidase